MCTNQRRPGTAFVVLGGFLSAAVLAIILSVTLSAKADKCDALKPTNAQNMSGEINGKIEGEITGMLKTVAGGSASIEGMYRKIITDTLINYPDSNKLYYGSALYTLLASIQTRNMT